MESEALKKHRGRMKKAERAMQAAIVTSGVALLGWHAHYQNKINEPHVVLELEKQPATKLAGSTN